MRGVSPEKGDAKEIQERRTQPPKRFHRIFLQKDISEECPCSSRALFKVKHLISFRPFIELKKDKTGAGIFFIVMAPQF